MTVVLGVDSSTQSTKVQALELSTGELVGSGSARHRSTTPPISEQDPNQWWSALVAALAQLPDAVRSRVVAMSVAGQQHGLVVLDNTGNAVRPAKLWNDTTSAPQAAALVETHGPLWWAQSVGSVPLAAFTVSKLAWLAEHEPAHVDQIARMCLPHDYLTWRLTGSFVTDRGDASGTGWFNPQTNTYCGEALQAGGVDQTWIDRLPRVLAPTEVAGTLLASRAAELGLDQTVIVAAGSGDNMAGALGLGLGQGDLAMSLGTSGVVSARSATPTADPTGAIAGFADATGGFLPLVCTLNATKVTDSVARWLGVDWSGLAQLALDAAGPDELAVVPWFDGERTPNRPDAAGSFAGLRTDTTRAQLARAAHDGVLCGLFLGIDALASCGVATGGTLHLIGGGARSAAYRQRCADLWGRDIRVPTADETVATGAAVQAAVASGFGSFEEVQQRWQLGGGIDISPDPNASAESLEIRDRYRTALA